MLKQRVLRFAERLTDTRIYPAWKITERGIDLYRDLNELNTPITTVFDVGANVGQSTVRYLREFPGAQIHAFEPVDSLFAQLDKIQNPLLKKHRLALGSRSTQGFIENHGEMSKLSDHGEPVTIETLDAFCLDIPKISFLKIDTEGSDLEVLKGASLLLAEKRVDVIQVEAGMNRLNNHHVPIQEFLAFLEPRGYFLFGIYEQVNEWPSGQPHLRRSNLVFIPLRTA